ncbi:hypothetical protein PHYC_03075 [Phycisphaerales bacterium]|nr:hypothetical protein PHYC_03075 [Phycisphaerales bacterium]
MSMIVQRYRGLPRSARWLVWLLALVVAYFGLVERVLDFYAYWRAEGDRSEAGLVKLAEAGDIVKRAGNTALDGVKHFGGVDYPGDPNARVRVFNKAVTEILSKHSISGETSTTRTMPLTGNGPLVKKLPANFRIDRVTRVLEFEAEPDAIVKVIADLEQSPLVSTISNVQIMRQAEGRDQSSRHVHASITVETWVMAKKERSNR